MLFLFSLHAGRSRRRKGDFDQLQVCGPVYAPILHQNRIVFFFFFSFSSVRNAVDIQNAQSYGKVKPSCVSCLSEKLADVQIDDVTRGLITTPPNVDSKLDFSEFSMHFWRLIFIL